MKKRIIFFLCISTLLIVLCCVVYAFDYQKPDWCSYVSRYNGYYRYTVNDDLKYVFYNGEGTAADSAYISSAFEYFSINENALHESTEGSSGSNIYSQIDFSADNVIFFDYYAVTSAGYNRHEFYYFIPDDKNISKEDLFYFVSAPKGSGSSSAGSVWSKSAKKIVSGTFYRGQASYDSNVEKAYVYVYYNCAGPSSIPYEGTFDIESDIACYMTSNSIDDVYTGNIQPDNAEDLSPKRYGVLEPPQDLKFIDKGLFSDNETRFSWTQNDENYKLWDTEIMVHGDIGYKLTIDIFGAFDYTGSLLLKTDVINTSKLNYKFVLTELVQEARPIYQPIIAEKYGDKGTHVQIQYCVVSFRNKYYDGQFTYYSNWVKVYIDEDGDYAVEYEYDDPVNGDKDVDYSHDPPDSNVSPDSPYQGGSINSDVTFSGLSEFISDGFGLAGENGIIDMFSDLFSFIPVSIWTLILTGLSVLIAIALLKAVL